MNYKIKLFVLLLIFFSFTGLSCRTAFGYEEKQVETIREMQENATKLKKEQEKLEFQWSTFKIGNESLGDILKDVNEKQVEEISIIVSEYQEKRTQGEKKLEKAIRYENDTSEHEKELLILKKDFYTSLLPFISDEKIEEFKKYISHDVEYNEKSKKINTEIQVIEVKKKERIEEIKEQIEDNNKLLRKRIQEKVTTRLEKVLGDFTSREKFKNLDSSAKIEVFKRIQEKVNSKKEEVENSSLSSSIREEKILLLQVIDELLGKYISDWS